MATFKLIEEFKASAARLEASHPGLWPCCAQKLLCLIGRGDLQLPCGDGLMALAALQCFGACKAFKTWCAAQRVLGRAASRSAAAWLQSYIARSRRSGLHRRWQSPMSFFIAGLVACGLQRREALPRDERGARTARSSLAGAVAP